MGSLQYLATPYCKKGVGLIRSQIDSLLLAEYHTRSYTWLYLWKATIFLCVPAWAFWFKPNTTHQFFPHTKKTQLCSQSLMWDFLKITDFQKYLYMYLLIREHQTWVSGISSDTSRIKSIQIAIYGPIFFTFLTNPCSMLELHWKGKIMGSLWIYLVIVGIYRS